MTWNSDSINMGMSRSHGDTCVVLQQNKQLRQMYFRRSHIFGLGPTLIATACKHSCAFSPQTGSKEKVVPEPLSYWGARCWRRHRPRLGWYPSYLPSLLPFPYPLRIPIQQLCQPRDICCLWPWPVVLLLLGWLLSQDRKVNFKKASCIIREAGVISLHRLADMSQNILQRIS